MLLAAFLVQSDPQTALPGNDITDLVALVSLYGLVADPATISDHLATLSFFLPASAFQVVEDQIGRIVTQNEGALSLKFVIGLLVSLWGANSGITAVIDGLNVAYEEEERRDFLRLNLLSLALTIGAVIAVLAAIGVVVVAPIALGAMDLAPAAESAVAIARWPLTFAFLVMAILILYRFGLSRRAAKWRWITWGAAFAVTLMVLVSLGLSWYLSDFADYNKTYGSLGAAIGFMTWIWLSSCALVGAEFNAEMEHQTARNTTEGVPQPIGLRRAKVADTLEDQHGSAAWMVPEDSAAFSQGPTWALEDNDVPCGPAPRPHRRAIRFRRPNQR